MKVRIGLATIISFVLMALICPSVQADEGGVVDLTAEVVTYQITNLATSNPTRNSIDLTWTTPAVEVRPFSHFDVRYSRTTITTANWDEATRVAGEPAPVAGASQGMTVTGLSSGTRYYFAMKVVDEKGLVGLLSNVAARTTSPRPVVTVGAAGRPPPAPPPGTTDVSGKVSTTGRFIRSVAATSEDELCTLTIPEGTVGLTEELEPLDEITMVMMDEPPPPPEDANIVGLAYDFGPDGATFDPAITLEYTYDPADIPEGIAEEDMVLAYYDEEAGEWVELEGCVVDTVTHTITASVSHFTTFAVIARRPVPPPPPPAPVPAAFSVSNLSIKPAEVEPKEAVAISLSIANTGGTEGSYTVVLKINGVKEVEKRVTLAAGITEMWALFVEREELGTYSVTVDGLSGSFTVVAPPVPVPEVKPPVVPPVVPEVKPPFPWPLVGGIIGGVVVVGLCVFFWIRRREVRAWLRRCRTKWIKSKC